MAVIECPNQRQLREGKGLSGPQFHSTMQSPLRRHLGKNSSNRSNAIHSQEGGERHTRLASLYVCGFVVLQFRTLGEWCSPQLSTYH